ncbi:GyrI-like domain-containing protein [Streptomyces olivaceoviridis]|uniref:GyrI-like domain-containing protein n=1 Tax=Streptomyces olivaceoviridis TaxID=1921 RepID=UPI0036FE31F8
MSLGNTTQHHPYHRLYEATSVPALLEVPPLEYLAVDGEGDPQDSKLFAAAIETLYAAATAVAAASGGPRPGDADHGPSPLEGLWWSTDPDLNLHSGDPACWRDRTSWRWTLLLRQRHAVDAATLAAARAELTGDCPTPEAAAAVSALGARTLREGLCVQVLHEGPIENEPATVGALHRHLDAQGLVPAGRHHEIYLVPSHTAPPSRLRTVLRQPVRRRGR